MDKIVKKIKVNGVEYNLIPQINDKGFLLVGANGLELDIEKIKEQVQGLISNEITSIANEVSALSKRIQVLANTISSFENYDDSLITQSITQLQKNKQDTIKDLADIRDGAGKGKTALQKDDLSGYAKTDDLHSVATTGKYSDLQGLPQIPSIEGLVDEGFVSSAINDAIIKTLNTEV